MYKRSDALLFNYSFDIYVDVDVGVGLWLYNVSTAAALDKILLNCRMDVGWIMDL